MAKTGLRIACAIGVVGLLTPAFATEQVYHPISPTFGGNPNNGPFLLSTAQSQGEGTKSGNQGPDLTPLANALSGVGGSGGSGGNGSSGGSGANGSGANAANPLATFSGRF